MKIAKYTIPAYINECMLCVVQSFGLQQLTKSSPRIFITLKGIILGLLLCLTANTWAAYQDLANDDNIGRKMYWIDRILRIEDDEQIDIANAALILSREWGTARRTRHYYLNTINNMSQEIIDRLKKEDLPRNFKAIPVINKYLFEELGFAAVATADDPEDLFLHSVIDNKRGYCLSLSILYLSIAERIGLPLHGVVVPGHFFVRYDDGRVKFNIETTAKGAMAKDDHYIKKFSPQKKVETLYMKNLTKKQTLGCFFNNLGNSYNAVGEIDIAEEELIRATRINPTLTEAHTNLGNIYLRKNQPYLAIEQYRISLAILPNDYKTHNNIANAYSALNQHSLAIDEYKASIRLNPDFPDAYRNLANTYRTIGKPENALIMLKKAAKLNPDDPLTYRYLGDTSRQTGDLGNAVIYYRKVLQYESASPYVHVSIAYCLLELDRTKAAVGEFNNALTIDPENADAWFGIAVAYNKLKMTDDEIFAYQQLLQINPVNAAAHLNIGNAFIAKQMYDLASEHYLSAIEIDPDNPDYYYNLGVAYANLKEYLLASAQYEYAVKLDPTSAMAHNGLAISSYMLEKFEKAYKHALIAKQLGIDVPKQLLEIPSKP